MAAINDSAEINVEHLDSLLRDWLQMHEIRDVEFRAKRAPAYKPDEDDYKVIYEAVFEPKTANKAMLEIWLTDEGFVGFGFERKSRISTNLGGSSSGEFATGQEPSVPFSDAIVIALLEAVASGAVKLQIKHRMFGGRKIRAVAAPVIVDELRKKSSGKLNWIYPLKKSSKSNFIEYCSW